MPLSETDALSLVYDYKCDSKGNSDAIAAWFLSSSEIDVETEQSLRNKTPAEASTVCELITQAEQAGSVHTVACLMSALPGLKPEIQRILVANWCEPLVLKNDPADLVSMIRVLSMMIEHQMDIGLQVKDLLRFGCCLAEQWMDVGSEVCLYLREALILDYKPEEITREWISSTVRIYGANDTFVSQAKFARRIRIAMTILNEVEPMTATFCDPFVLQCMTETISTIPTELPLSGLKSKSLTEVEQSLEWLIEQVPNSMARLFVVVCCLYAAMCHVATLDETSDDAKADMSLTLFEAIITHIISSSDRLEATMLGPLTAFSFSLKRDLHIHTPKEVAHILFDWVEQKAKLSAQDELISFRGVWGYGEPSTTDHPSEFDVQTKSDDQPDDNMGLLDPYISTEEKTLVELMSAMLPNVGSVRFGFLAVALRVARANAGNSIPLDDLVVNVAQDPLAYRKIFPSALKDIPVTLKEKELVDFLRDLQVKRAGTKKGPLPMSQRKPDILRPQMDWKDHNKTLTLVRHQYIREEEEERQIQEASRRAEEAAAKEAAIAEKFGKASRAPEQGDVTTNVSTSRGSGARGRGGFRGRGRGRNHHQKDRREQKMSRSSFMNS